MEADRRRGSARIEIHMDTNQEIIDWMARTRESQGLNGTVSYDPELHAQTLAAVERTRRIALDRTRSGAKAA